VRDDAALGATIPLLRTFESPRFRLLVAALLALSGFALNLARLSGYDPADTGLAFDFAAYYHAAERMLAGSSPYTADQLGGTGAGLCLDCYLYPPFFAQLLSPLTLLPLAAAKVAWLVISYVAAFVSTWLATGIGGARRSLERAVWCLVAVLLFDGVASAAWNGNVGTIVALGVTLVALGGVAAGVGAGLGVLLKVAPATFLPAVFTADRESRTALLLTLLIVVGSLFLLAPQAWLEYPMVLGDVFSRPSETRGNLAINHILTEWGWRPDAISFVRTAMRAAPASRSAFGSRDSGVACLPRPSSGPWRCSSSPGPCGTTTWRCSCRSLPWRGLTPAPAVGASC
jgi:hypothetical protein